MERDFEDLNLLPKPKYSKKHKVRMNRMFREVVGSEKIPYPEIDNCYERIRSRIIRKANIFFTRQI